MLKENFLRELKKAIASSNMNFLIGAGASSKFLSILNDIENDISLAEIQGDSEKIIELKQKYFIESIVGSIDIVDENNNSNKNKTLEEYKDFYKTLSFLLLKREDSILSKQINIFTTNVDIFSEKALEEVGIEFNDGFSGRFKPVYDASNFKKSYFRKSLHYENTSEIPVFNVVKLHGSVSWLAENDSVVLDKDLTGIKTVNAKLSTKEFNSEFDKLKLINPTKQKLEDTVIIRYYYDLLRFYSNELEKENNILFVIGFSFCDEHINSLTLQVADSNPTLIIYIFSYKSGSDAVYEKLKEKSKNNNIEILYPSDGNKYGLSTISKEVFGALIDTNVIDEDEVQHD